MKGKEQARESLEPVASPDAKESNPYPESAQLCQKCLTKAVILMDGCMTCLACGDSKCS